MSGLLNKVLTNGTTQEIGVIPGSSNGAYSMLNVVVSNPTSQEVKLEIWLTFNDEPTMVDYIEPGAMIPANGGGYEAVGRIASAGERLFVRTQEGLVVRAETIEDQ